MTETINTNTWCPIFPGFYGTVFEANDEDMEIENVNDQRAEAGKKALEFDDFDFDYAGYHLDVSKAVVSFIEDTLKEAGYADSVKFEELRSPREYNFANDCIDVEMVFTEDNINTIRKAIIANFDEWETYLADRYTSRSGFMSFHSNDANDWPIAESLKDKHKAASILEFLLRNDNEEIEMDAYYALSDHDCYLNCKNYTELIEKA